MKYLIFLLFAGPLSAQVTRVSLAEPVTETGLFYIARSTNANVVMYEANLGPDRQLDPEKPVNVYWIRYAEQGQKERLSSVQWHLAYGYKHRQPQPEAFDVYLNAFKKRPVRVVMRDGRPMAYTQINGRVAHLRKVFVQVDPDSGLMPRVQYMELFGTDTSTDKMVSERIVAR
jgi:hypothetical protein